LEFQHSIDFLPMIDPHEIRKQGFDFVEAPPASSGAGAGVSSGKVAQPPQPVVDGPALDKDLEALIDQKAERRRKGMARSKRVFAAIVVVLLVAAGVGVARSPGLRGDLWKAVQDVRNGEMSMAKIIETYQRQIAKLKVRSDQIDASTRALGVDPESVIDDDPYMKKEIDELVGDFDDSGAMPVLALLPGDFDPSKPVQMSLPPLDDDAGPVGDLPAPAVSLQRPLSSGDRKAGGTTDAAMEDSSAELAADAQGTSDQVDEISAGLGSAPDTALELAPPTTPTSPPRALGEVEAMAQLWNRPASDYRVFRATNLPKPQSDRYAKAAAAPDSPAASGVVLLPSIEGGPDGHQVQVNVRVDGASAVSFSEIRFKSGSDQFQDPESSAQVRKIAEAMKLAPEAEFLVESHTCDLGSAASNKSLTARRANRIATELARNGVKPGRLMAIGFGSELPRVVNDSDENRKKNRRITIVRRIP
jgi:outer membrane protein OmpA-like peptidoglycan-associated protein